MCTCVAHHPAMDAHWCLRSPPPRIGLFHPLSRLLLSIQSLLTPRLSDTHPLTPTSHSHLVLLRTPPTFPTSPHPHTHPSIHLTTKTPTCQSSALKC